MFPRHHRASGHRRGRFQGVHSIAVGDEGVQLQSQSGSHERTLCWTWIPERERRKTGGVTGFEARSSERPDGGPVRLEVGDSGGVAERGDELEMLLSSSSFLLLTGTAEDKEVMTEAEAVAPVGMFHAVYAKEKPMGESGCDGMRVSREKGMQWMRERMDVHGVSVAYRGGDNGPKKGKENSVPTIPKIVFVWRWAKKQSVCVAHRWRDSIHRIC